MYEITKRFTFSAAHHLDGLPLEHQCSRVHGHNYVAALCLRSDTLNGPGFVVDYGDLSTFRDYINRYYDHRDLNCVVEGNPTAEYLASVFYEATRGEAWADLVHSVTVSETDGTTATYWP